MDKQDEKRMNLKDILDDHALIAFREWNGEYCTCSTNVCAEGQTRCIICNKRINPRDSAGRKS